MEKKEFKNFYRTVGSNEGSKCHYPTRLDTYGCGCSHDCSYCYAKAQMTFRGKWDPKNPSIVDVEKMKRKIRQLEPGTIVRLGGLTDCFQPIEKTQKVTMEAIKALNKQRVGYLIVTKSAMVADDDYIQILDRELAHIQISITSTDDQLAATYEKASPSSKRIEAIEKLYDAGFDVAVRLSPLIPGYFDFDIINAIRCDKILVEFLRNEMHIKKTFPIDWSEWTVIEEPYGHLTLERKKELLAQLTGFKEISVCEDCSEHYDYWRDNFNPNPQDCCNLSIPSSVLKRNEERRLSEKQIRTKVRFKLKVLFSDGTTILENQVKDTFVKAIEYAGGSVVRGLGIMKNGSPLVVTSLSEVPERYRSEVSANRIDGGFYVFAHMSTDAKANVLKDISSRLGECFKVEYVEQA